LDKDWIWILKKFIGYGSRVKKSISVHLWLIVEASVATFDVLTSDLMFSKKFLITDVLAKNLMLTGLLFLFSAFLFLFE